jgi:hypothetical protein
MTAPDPWAGLIDPDETILWQGRPDPRPHWAALSPQRMILGVVFTAFSLFWIAQAAAITRGGGMGGIAGLFPLFGLPFLAVGLYQLGGHVLWDAFRRGRTWYTLTDRRAFVATDLPFRGKQLKSYPITRETVLTFDDAELASIGFAFEPVPMKRGTRMKMVGFERIPDGRSVYALIRGVQGKIERDWPLDDRTGAE